MSDAKRIERVLWEALRLKVLDPTLTAERAVARAEANLKEIPCKGSYAKNLTTYARRA